MINCELACGKQAYLRQAGLPAASRLTCRQQSVTNRKYNLNR